ncbi:hypothetical protein TNCV_2591801 [Trichonephila clavipes]|nr:hypothetical protein TNCV_2591801 [Trichonephila clavipes]
MLLNYIGQTSSEITSITISFTERLDEPWTSPCPLPNGSPRSPDLTHCGLTLWRYAKGKFMQKLWRWKWVVSPSIVPSGNFAELNRTVTCMVLKANDKRTSSPLPR